MLRLEAIMTYALFDVGVVFARPITTITDTLGKTPFPQTKRIQNSLNPSYPAPENHGLF